MRVGVFGGTFDPVHNGHLAVAEEAGRTGRLGKVYFVPASQPWMKNRVITPAAHRLAMLELAVKGRRLCEISRFEIERSGPSYTVDTLTALRAQLDARDELYFILGWDSLATLPGWCQPGRIIELCRLLAAPRPGSLCPDLRNLEKALPGISRRVSIMEKPCLDISASEIRHRVEQRLPIDSMVPEPVARYIRERGLYKAQEGNGAEGGI